MKGFSTYIGIKILHLIIAESLEFLHKKFYTENKKKTFSRERKKY